MAPVQTRTHRLGSQEGGLGSQEGRLGSQEGGVQEGRRALGSQEGGIQEGRKPTNHKIIKFKANEQNENSFR